MLNAGGGIAVAFESLPRGPVHIAFQGSQSETFSVWTTTTRHGFRTTPKVPADLVTLRFVNSGYMSRDNAAGQNIVAGFGQALFTSYLEMRSEMASPGFSAISATVSREALDRAWLSLYGAGRNRPPTFEIVADVTTPGMIALRSTLSLLQHQLLDNQGSDSLMTSLLEELLIYQLLSAWPSSGAPDTSSAAPVEHRAIRLAMEYIESNLARKMEISEIATAAGVSVRMLQLMFKARLGCGPFSYLIGRRLDQVHNALQTSDAASIRETAHRWGFVHMADLSRRYKERFGCTPTQTRARRTCRNS
ncbi:helix-turn-helix domain-containing protein [Sphingomonas elodea]|uniref:helix-turn-helix domain-containing protein n=1 Tax=Sphingomonas elodea TaxID=179878 RepID=UPI0002FAB354|nr:AraC family transcriptional regulator [Sphingomonas elodea]